MISTHQTFENMPKQPSSTFFRRITQAYIQSNIHWPQTRASFVLVFLNSIEAEDIECLEIVISLPESIEWKTDTIVQTTDKLHAEHGIWTVYPTKPLSVIRELNQSCKVLHRTLSVLLDVDDQLRCDVNALRTPASNIWSWIRKADFVEANKALITGPESGPARADRIMPKDNANLAGFWRSLLRNFPSGQERKILSALEPEILHAITVVRPQV